MQVIVGALAAGLVMFFVMVLVMRDQAAVQENVSSPISILAIAAVFAGLVMRAVVSRYIVGQMRREEVEGKPPIAGSFEDGRPASAEAPEIRALADFYQTKLIVGCAILEGAGFFNLLAFLLEGQRMNLVAAGVLTIILFSQFPTASRLESWIEDELATIDRLRSSRRT